MKSLEQFIINMIEGTINKDYYTPEEKINTIKLFIEGYKNETKDCITSYIKSIQK